MDNALWIAVGGLMIFAIFTRLHVRRVERRLDRFAMTMLGDDAKYREAARQHSTHTR